MGKSQLIAIDSIDISGGTQPRAEIDTTTVNEYAEAMKGGERLPPVTVFQDGSTYWLADGFHRYHAARKNNSKKIEAVVHQGTVRDAILHSVGANHANGLRRSNADKRNSVLTMLNDEEWWGWSDREIARQCAVSQAMVTKVREGFTDNGYQSGPRRGSDGRTQQTGSEKRKKAAKKKKTASKSDSDATFSGTHDDSGSQGEGQSGDAATGQSRGKSKGDGKEVFGPKRRKEAKEKLNQFIRIAHESPDYEKRVRPYADKLMEWANGDK